MRIAERALAGPLRLPLKALPEDKLNVLELIRTPTKRRLMLLTDLDLDLDPGA